MKKTIPLAACLLILTSLFLYGMQNKAKDLPEGIDPEVWIPVADNFGIVLTESPDKRIEVPRRRVQGTLMVKIDGRWRVLNLNFPISIMPIHE